MEWESDEEETCYSPFRSSSNCNKCNSSSLFNNNHSHKCSNKRNNKCNSEHSNKCNSKHNNKYNKINTATNTTATTSTSTTSKSATTKCSSAPPVKNHPQQYLPLQQPTAEQGTSLLVSKWEVRLMILQCGVEVWANVCKLLEILCLAARYQKLH